VISLRPARSLLLVGSRSWLPLLEAWSRWAGDGPGTPACHLAWAGPFPPDLPRPEALPDPLKPLAAQFAAAAWGLSPGMHRLSFGRGRVLVTIGVGPPLDLLREFSGCFDDVAVQEGPWTGPALDAELRRLQQAAPSATAAPSPRDCVVVGGGLAGAACAAALARRGWSVEVLDAAAAPAAGASGLPAGLLAPHLSADDNLLSQLSRVGVRMTLQACQDLLRPGEDWSPCGVLEHRPKPYRGELPEDGAGADWSRPASHPQRTLARLPPASTAVWHAPGAWVRPAALVHAWLREPGVRWRGGMAVARIEATDSGWRLSCGDGKVLATAPLVVLAAALGTRTLSGNRVWLHAVRGQVSWALRQGDEPLAPFAINGHGHLLPAVPVPGGTAWMSGSTYGREDCATDLRQADHLANLERLRTLLPLTADALAAAFLQDRVRGWAGVRCASTDRRPLVGPLQPGLWVSTAMGSRGLTFAWLCAELLAARLHAEPLPLMRTLAAALDLGRQLRPG
jgi:tRNA 5-methylaminomethyl-2-thiouridine biosynthesis bifunctional protein